MVTGPVVIDASISFWRSFNLFWRPEVAWSKPCDDASFLELQARHGRRWIGMALGCLEQKSYRHVYLQDTYI